MKGFVLYIYINICKCQVKKAKFLTIYYMRSATRIKSMYIAHCLFYLFFGYIIFGQCLINRGWMLWMTIPLRLSTDLPLRIIMHTQRYITYTCVYNAYMHIYKEKISGLYQILDSINKIYNTSLTSLYIKEEFS